MARSNPNSASPGSVALLDAPVAAMHGNATVAMICVGLFVLTLALQRIVPGT